MTSPTCPADRVTSHIIVTVASGSVLMTLPSPARYQGGSPASAKEDDFPVRPGGEMPGVAGCTKQDYWVLFVVALENK